MNTPQSNIWGCRGIATVLWTALPILSVLLMKMFYKTYFIKVKLYRKTVYCKQIDKRKCKTITICD